jgi:hypothetical protein
MSFGLAISQKSLDKRKIRAMLFFAIYKYTFMLDPGISFGFCVRNNNEENTHIF